MSAALCSPRLVSQRGIRALTAAIILPGPTPYARRYGGVRHLNYGPGPETVFSTEFWKRLVPKPFRSGGRARKQKKTKSKDWNPATFYIIIFLFIGSMSIQMIALRKNFDNFMRQSEVRIGLLREVVEKLQRGEKVDVERALGAGVAEKEQDWDDVLREIENSTPKPKSKRQKKQATDESSEDAVVSEPVPKSKSGNPEFY